MNHYWSVSEPVVVGELTNSGSLTDQYRLIFPSLASPFLPPRREMPPRAVEKGEVPLLWIACLGLLPAMMGISAGVTLSFCFVYNAFGQGVKCSV